ncbi:centrosomal protein of 126 kDa [Elgaria multicarinata webbii]|uniref:centrosomal protein of 126 kDa n=1 Tax=Elgaria multicarinata webbii TaxID=159646 RepID=UPI002FCD52B9
MIRNLKILLERDLSKERHELLKDQRLSRNRARKHCIETNKRRRALEDKWKEDEEKEQKFREQILLQRKLKHQEATERFQRSHLSSSQSKRGGAQRKTELKLDEALQKIQAPGFQLSSSKVIVRNGPFHWKLSSETAGFDRIKQENCRAHLDSDQLLFQQNLDEMQQQLREQHFDNLQDFHQEVNEIAHSESVCSVDSLEAGEPNESCTTPSETSSLTTQLDSSALNSQGMRTRNKCFSDETDISFSKRQHVNNWLINLNTSNIQTTSPFRDILIKYNVVPSDEDTCSPGQKSSAPSTSEQREAERWPDDDDLNFTQIKREDKNFVLKLPSSGIVSRENPLATDMPELKLNKAWASPDPSPVVAVQENSEFPQNNRTSSTQASTQDVVIPVVFPIRECSATAPYSNSFLLNCMQKGKNAHAARCTEDIGCVTAAGDEKCFDHVDVEAPLFENTYKGSIDQQKDNEEEKVNEILSVPHGDLTDNLSDLDQERNNPSERKVVKLPKSILKKGSKYEPGCFKAMVINRGVKFGNQPVASARDSVELAKIKGKDADIQKNCKKLRWFDEINEAVRANYDEKFSEQGIAEIPQAQPQSSGFRIKVDTSRTNLRSIPSCTLNSVFPEDHLENSQKSANGAMVGDSERDNGIQNAFVSAGYHVAKQAWMAPRSEEIIPLVYNCDPKNPRSNPRKGRTKMIKRPKSAKAPSSTLITKNRKGTIIRPQSATEATKVMKTQGKIMMPHPPSKPTPGKRLDENPSDSMCKPPTETENSHFLNERHLLPEGQDLGRDTTEDPSISSSSCHSHVATMRPSYSIFTYEPLKKTKCAQSAAQCGGFTKRGSMYSENGLCPDRTPTDEEITILWQGVNRALAQKDGAAGDSQHSAIPCNNNSNNADSQPSRPNVSHITIDGGNLMGSIKSGVRVNAIFSSQPSTSVAFARRKQINENNENKRKALLEHRRQMAASAGWKPNSVGKNISQAMKRAQSQCAYEPVQAMGGISNADEVSESTLQFLLAENLANMSATESEILTGLDTAQLHKQTVVLNRPPRQGMSALSFEEHKVLQSLDRINQRLQNVHETINKTPSSTDILQTVSPLVASPSYMNIMPPMWKYRSISDATYPPMHRKY